MHRLLVALLAATPALLAGQLVVDPMWEPYLYGNLPTPSVDPGILPTAIGVPSGAFSVTFNASGNVSCLGISFLVGPDGGSGCGSSDTDLTSGGGGISGIKAPTGMFLAGVFLGSSNPAAGTAPAALDYTGPLTINDLTYSPLLNQLFFVGDGQTSASVTQIFFVPTGAARLVLGWADGATAVSFHGLPCCYDDNASTTNIDPSNPKRRGTRELCVRHSGTLYTALHAGGYGCVGPAVVQEAGLILLLTSRGDGRPDCGRLPRRPTVCNSFETNPSAYRHVFHRSIFQSG